MNIRRYRAGEEEVLWKLYYDTTHLINGRDYSKEQVETWASNDKDMVKWKERIKAKNPFVAVSDGTIVGFAELEKDGHIDYFYCHHLWQHKGVGKLLYDAIEKEAHMLKIDCLQAEVSITAKPFFLSRGFEIVGEENNIVCGAVAKRFLMRKKLPD